MKIIKFIDYLKEDLEEDLPGEFFGFDEKSLREQINAIFKTTLNVDSADSYIIEGEEEAAQQIAKAIGGAWPKELVDHIETILHNTLSTPKGFYYIEGKDKAIEQIIDLVKGGKPPVRNGSFLKTKPGGILPPEPKEIIDATKRRNAEIGKSLGRHNTYEFMQDLYSADPAPIRDVRKKMK